MIQSPWRLVRAAAAPQMSAAHADPATAEQPSPRWHARLRRLAIIVLVVVLIGAAASLFGWDIGGWFEHLWNTITKISIGYLIAGIVLITVQTTTTAYAWYSILRFAYGRVAVRWMQVYACYATAVALNFVLPANLGTFVMLLMFLATIAGADLRRDHRRLRRPENLLHDPRGGDVAVPVRDPRRLVRPAVRVHRRTPRVGGDHRGRAAPP